MRLLTPVKIVAGTLFLITLSIAAHAGISVSDSRLVDGNGNTFEMRGSVRAKNNANSCMDVTGGYQTNGANVQLWACNGNPQQRWKLFRR